MKTFEGNLVVSRFNEFITSRLLGGALDGLKRRGVREEDIQTAWVPGAFEIPLIASKMAKSGKYDAVICLGAVIRGSTSHYDYVCNEVSKGIAAVSLENHHREHRAGHRALRQQGGQQGLRVCRGSGGDGEFDPLSGGVRWSGSCWTTTVLSMTA